MGEETVLDVKRAVGRAAAERVKSGMIVGLGTGSTTIHAIVRIGERLAAGEIEDIHGVPTSFQASVLAREQKVPLVGLDQIDHIDLAIDGADEVDPSLQLIKGGGAAHTREKIVDAFADTFVVVADESKVVERLGSRVPVPVEVLPMALGLASRALARLGGEPVLRMAERKAGPVVTDLGNLILDVRFPSIDDPGALERRINNIPGIVDNGLFVDLADVVLIGAASGDDIQVRELTRLKKAP